MKELFIAIKEKAIELGFELDFYHLEDDLNKAIKPELTVNFRHVKSKQLRKYKGIMAGVITYTYILTGQEYKNESDKMGWSNLSLNILTDITQLKKACLFETEITAFNSESGINVEVL